MEQHHREDSAALSALHILRSYNQLLQPAGLPTNCSPYNSVATTGDSLKPPNGVVTSIDFSPVLGAFQPYAALHFTGESPPDYKARRIFMNVNPLLVPGPGLSPRKSRGEKKAIPEEQKDEKYFERRKRNNQAAKKSRDARKLREDQVAIKATFLEHENAMLRAQVLTLREETQALRRLLLIYRKPDPCAITDVESKDSVVPLSAGSPLCRTSRLNKEGFE